MRRLRSKKSLLRSAMSLLKKVVAARLFEAGVDVFRPSMNHFFSEELAHTVAMLRNWERLFDRSIGALVA